MLKRDFDPTLAFRVVVYLRMSSSKQNERSPDQQLTEIKRRLKALGRKWTIVKVYRDDAVSGRYLRKRDAYQQMMRDLKTGAVVADLILCDTIERLARVEELPTIRKTLYEKHGILILTADSNFADPTTPQGKALGMFESMRASEDGRIKGHNVLRGKRDAVHLKHWPGGPRPFGYQLKKVMKVNNGVEEVDYSVPEPFPDESWIIVRLFDRADETGDGQDSLAKWLNRQDDIPERFKPFYGPTIGYWLDNPIYFGALRWDRKSTGIVDDVRVVEDNPEDEVTYIPEFCEPLIDQQIWERVQAVREVRRQQIRQSRERRSDGPEKQIKPLSPGRTVKHMLAGLVRCPDCKLAMVPQSSPVYVTKDGEERRYTSYMCPRYQAGACENAIHVPETWLVETVITTLRERLFPWRE